MGLTGSSQATPAKLRPYLWRFAFTRVIYATAKLVNYYTVDDYINISPI